MNYGDIMQPLIAVQQYFGSNSALHVMFGSEVWLHRRSKHALYIPYGNGYEPQEGEELLKAIIDPLQRIRGEHTTIEVRYHTMTLVGPSVASDRGCLGDAIRSAVASFIERHQLKLVLV